MSALSPNIFALAGVEIILGLTMLGTLMAIIVFFIGVVREKKASSSQLEQGGQKFKGANDLHEGIPAEEENVEAQQSALSEKAALPEKDKVTNMPADPVLPDNLTLTDKEELERQIIEKQLQRIADKRAEHKKAEDSQISRKYLRKTTDENAPPPTIPKPFLHELSRPDNAAPVSSLQPKQLDDPRKISETINLQREEEMQRRRIK